MTPDNTSPADDNAEREAADRFSGLTREQVRLEAQELLAILGDSRHRLPVFEATWRKLWQLAREATAAGLPARDGAGPWHWSRRPPGGRRGISPSLRAGDFILPIWPADEPRDGASLPTLLNWAGVLPP